MILKERHPFTYILTTRFKTRLINSLLEKDRRSLLLDVGCGSGFVLSQIEDKFNLAVGIDMSKEAVKYGSSFINSALIIGDAQRLPFKDSTFDCIISTDAFEHFPDDIAAIHEVKRLLRLKGYFIVYVPTQNGILSNTPFVDIFHKAEDSYLLDQHYYTIDLLKELARKGGLKVNYIGYHNIFAQEFFTQILKWLAWCLGKEYKSQADINSFINSSFFLLYRWLVLPTISFFVRLEEVICERLFRAKIPGHRIVMKCINEGV